MRTFLERTDLEERNDWRTHPITRALAAALDAEIEQETRKLILSAIAGGNHVTPVTAGGISMLQFVRNALEKE